MFFTLLFFIIIPYKTSEDCEEQEDCRISLIEDILHKVRKSVALLMFIATDLINQEGCYLSKLKRLASNKV